MARKLSVWQVIFREKADEIRRLVQKRVGIAPGHRKYLGYFQRAVTEIIDGMSDNEMEDMEAKRKEWEQEAYLADVQQRYISSNWDDLCIIRPLPSDWLRQREGESLNRFWKPFSDTWG